MFCFVLFFSFFVFVSVYFVFVFFLFYFSKLSTLQHCISVTVTARIAHLKLPFNPQFKYMTFIYINSRGMMFRFCFVSLRQILDANSSVC